MLNKLMKKCSKSLVIRELSKLKPQEIPLKCPLEWLNKVQQYLVLARMWSNWNSHSLLSGLYNHFGKTVYSFLIKLSIHLP